MEIRTAISSDGRVFCIVRSPYVTHPIGHDAYVPHSIGELHEHGVVAMLMDCPPSRDKSPLQLCEDWLEAGGDAILAEMKRRDDKYYGVNSPRGTYRPPNYDPLKKKTKGDGAFDAGKELAQAVNQIVQPSEDLSFLD